MSEAPSEKPKRRLRYKGTHPRQFHEKYKEHDPARYADDVARIVASGKTPAGTHRSIMVREILETLDPRPGDIAVDVTLGYGGHAGALLQAVLPGGKLIGLDVDPIELPKTESRLRALGHPQESLVVRRSNFAGLAKVLVTENIDGADVLLADLGLSSMQIDDPTRGFTFKRPGPLDLRMNPQRGQPASAFLSSLSATELAQLLEGNADEPQARRLAEAILERHHRQPITTTTELAGTITAALHTSSGIHGKPDAGPAIRRVFQAIRIAVNDEFGALDALLRSLPSCVKPAGRIAILTFHSGEDRRVKHAFKEGLRTGVYARVAEEVIRPAPEEQHANPRATPAKLRWAVRN